jgi:sterol 3beta-glucosyltransferase
MKIGLQTWGTEGDIRPFIALSRGLSAAGHEVTLSFADVAFTVTPRLAALSAAKHLISLPPPYDAETFRRVSQEITASKPRSAQFPCLLEEFLNPMETLLFEDAERLCRDHDLVVGHCLLYTLAAAAKKHHRPRVAVVPSPVQPSKEWVPAGVPNMGRWLNGLFWKLGTSYFERNFGAPAERLFRAQGLAAPHSILNDVWSSPLLNLVAVSPALFPQPRDWPAHTRVIGALAPPEDSSWQMPEPLRRFLAQGPAPLFATFGSMVAAEGDVLATTQELVEGALRAGCRAIVQSDWTLAAGVAEHPDIYRLSCAPHSEIFPHCSVVVHHGGAGTSHAAARAGRPSVVVAHVVDQLFWAAALRRAGIAGAPLERRSLTADRLARRIREVVGSEEMSRRARQVGEAMRGEDGVKAAVESIGALAGAAC